MQVTRPNINVHAVSKHVVCNSLYPLVPYSLLFPAVYFRVVTFAACCTVVSSFSTHQPTFSILVTFIYVRFHWKCRTTAV